MELHATLLYRHSGKAGQEGWHRSWWAGNVVAMQLPRVHRGLASSVAINGSVGLFLAPIVLAYRVLAAASAQTVQVNSCMNIARVLDAAVF